jgi:hypothetical protein
MAFNLLLAGPVSAASAGEVDVRLAIDADGESPVN